MNAAEWRELAMHHQEDARRLRERLLLMRIDPATLAVNFTPVPVDPERIEQGRRALRAELANIEDRKANGLPTDEEFRQAVAVADAILAALGEPQLSGAVSGANLAPPRPETADGRTETAAG